MREVEVETKGSPLADGAVTDCDDGDSDVACLDTASLQSSRLCPKRRKDRGSFFKA